MNQDNCDSPRQRAFDEVGLGEEVNDHLDEITKDSSNISEKESHEKKARSPKGLNSPKDCDLELGDQGYGTDESSPDLLSELANEKRRRQSWRWLSVLASIDSIMSERLARNDNKCLEVILFMVPARLFNRCTILVPIFFTFLLGTAFYDQMLEKNGYRPAGADISDADKLGYGACFCFLYGLSLLLMVCCTQCMKYTIKRERPKCRADTTRL